MVLQKIDNACGRELEGTAFDATSRHQMMRFCEAASVSLPLNQRAGSAKLGQPASTCPVRLAACCPRSPRQSAIHSIRMRKSKLAKERERRASRTIADDNQAVRDTSARCSHKRLSERRVCRNCTTRSILNCAVNIV